MARPQPRYKKGDKIGGRYQVHDVKMGGMGEVYLCMDLEEMYPYALKTFQQRYLTNAKIRKAFEHEVATWVALEKHPNIVRCFYLESFYNQPFMRLEWIIGERGRGTDLRDWLWRGPLGLRQSLDFIIDICRGLKHAYEKQPGIVHRDLKPENILIGQRKIAKITDFGLAQIVYQSNLKTTTNLRSELNERQSLMGQHGIVGTPPYMAPEQWRGEALDSRTDMYAVGCILYEMLTGTWPFTATTLEDFERKHSEVPIPTVTTDSILPAKLISLLYNCLAKSKENRFPTIDDLLQELLKIYQKQFAIISRSMEVGGEFTVSDFHNRGNTYADLRYFDEALSDYERAIQLDPDYAPIYNNRGSVYAELGHHDVRWTPLSRQLEGEK